MGRQKSVEWDLKTVGISKVCSLLSHGEWIIERDDDLTGAVASSGQQWIALDDDLTAKIKVIS